MAFERYEHLSEDAQRLLCYYVHIGLGTDRRMGEHAYLLERNCFPMFDGERAQQELIDAAIFCRRGRDRASGFERIDIFTSDIVPALWYLYERRKDMLLTLQKCAYQQTAMYQTVREAIQELVETNHHRCDNAGLLAPTQAELFLSVAHEPAFHTLLASLSADSFVHFFNQLSDYLCESDTVTDAAPLLNIIQLYGPITESTRCHLAAQIELYDYIANGKLPSGGAYTDMAAGCTMGAIHHLCHGRPEEAMRWFGQSLRLQDSGANSSNLTKSLIPCFFLIVTYISVAHGDNPTMTEECHRRLKDFLLKTRISPWRQALPGKILAEDFEESNLVMQRKQIDTLYEEGTASPRMAAYRHLAFLIANYLGCSSTSMDASLCVPRLALLRHEMSKYLQIDDNERQRLASIYGEQPALTSIYHKAEWESVLESLMQEAKSDSETQSEPTARLMYLRTSMASRNIQVREQTRLKSGGWSNGKQVSDARYRRGELECMNETDRRILARLNHSDHWELLLEDVAEEMVNDCRLYIGSTPPFEPVTVNHDRPYLIVENEGNSFVVKSNVPLNLTKDDPIIVQETPTRYSLLHIPYDIRGYYTKLLQLGSLPLEAEETLRNLLETIGGKVELHSSLIDGGSTLPLVEGQWNVGLRLTPRQGGNWEIEPFVRPLPEGRRTYKIGIGDRIVIDENKEGRARVKRNLELERSNGELLRSFWESQGLEYQEKGAYTPDFLLALVLMIQEHPETFYAEWPEGHTMKVRNLARGHGSWSGVVKQRGLWFDIEGDVDIDESTKLSISQLLELVGKSNGRFVQLSDGEYLALSDTLKRQLQALDAIANRSQGNIQISPFSAALMGEDLLHGELSLSLDKPLIETRQRILECSNYSPEVPKELQATLRPYQLDGYLWIARLNSWGAGALLADDMGLGKTIQTIAFLLLKKEEGPSLVVAPASVAPNWLTELERFAPCLNVQLLNFAHNRQKVINEAKAGDVIVTTYGILLSIQDDITSKHWNVACLDEAHIIKNRGAKTSAAAMRIQANNRVMLTGTPVQNHLGELWSLFQFVNPGLLGTYEHFSRKFIVPIEGYQDREKQEQLERIVHPFMLRRTKQAVLRELPEKTEIYYPVEMSTDEIAIYESIRTRAEKMLQAKGNNFDMNVLTEITRLRQAACSVQLIEPKWTGESSKITALVELLQGVIEGGNRGLVFSQFVSFLTLVRKELDRLGMHYFYIDGSTPVKQRTEMVEAFQQGTNPLFLISLKAGGLGLNLTGANYVFHLDPWWNPAIEQQATDRAYRIGQNQAVTVYHLVSQHTIEEKILRLHQTKRDLADNILAGTDVSHRLTGKDLLELVQK